MPFLYRGGVVPGPWLGIRVLKEIEQVLGELRLIEFGDGQIVAAIAMDAGTPPLLGVHGMGFAYSWNRNSE